MSKYFSEIFERDKCRCVYCGRDMLTDFEIFSMVQEDHLVPIAKGGEDKPENIVTACSVCNKLKGTFDPGNFDLSKREEYIAKVRRHIMERRAERIRVDYISWTHPSE